jgi:hypothetical protein
LWDALLGAALSLLKSGAASNLLEAGIAAQAIYRCVHPFESKRSIIHRFVQPDERLTVLAEAGVYERDVERYSICSSRAIEHGSQYPPRLRGASGSAEHVAKG